MLDCLFCKIMANEIPANKIYEDEKIIAFLDINPINPGHTLVAPKEHYATLLDLPEDLACAAIRVIKKITPAILSAAGATDFNLGLNNGHLAGQAVNHFHWHIMPRHANDGHHLFSSRPYGAGEAEQMAARIVDFLTK